MNEFDVFTPVFTNGPLDLEILITPVIGIIVLFLIGKFSERFMKILARIRSRMGSGLVQSEPSEYRGF